jgi:UDP-N-acetylmuramyl pentapeptide phosphotransferase/UDP-N-acetylglucosamine-1-phosphate transferase
LLTYSVRALAVALVLSLAFQPLAIRILRARKVVDVPGERSSHHTVTVRGGGVVVMLALLAGALAQSRDPISLVLLTVGLMCAAIGFAEDVVGVPVARRFGLLLLALLPLGLLIPGPPMVQVAGIAVAVLFALAVVNATNFMDGVNGISAAHGLVAGMAYALLAYMHDLSGQASVALATAGAVLGFAPYNVPRARVFLGDSGSYGLGGVLGGLAVSLFAAGLPPEAILAPLGLYATDTSCTLLRRFRAGETLHLPHRTHTYQQLTDLGYSHVQVSGLFLALGLLCSVLGALSLVGPGPRLLGDLALIGLLAAYQRSPRLLARPPAAR